MSGIGANLVYALFWKERDLQYRAFVRVRDCKFYFEGRIRLLNGEHEYFPCEDWHVKDIGTAEKAKNLVSEYLATYGCPIADIEHCLERMDDC